jgi:putative transcriptional regulator
MHKHVYIQPLHTLLTSEGEEMDKPEMLGKVQSLFKAAHFHLSQNLTTKPCCLDFAARRQSKLVFIKVKPNIGYISEDDAYGLATLSEAFNATSLLISEKTRTKPLEDDTLYTRYGVGAITIRTLEDALVHGHGPLIEAGPGGYYVELDGEAIQNVRLKKGLSIGKTAELLGVSRRTLYGYEKGMTKASVSTTYKLTRMLGIPVAKPINLDQPLTKTKGFIAAAKRILTESRIIQLIINKFHQLNFTVFQLKRAPFDFIAENKNTRTTLIGSIAHEKDEHFTIKIEDIASLSKIIGAQPILITENDNLAVDRIPLINHKDFEHIKCCEDLMAIL